MVEVMEKLEDHLDDDVTELEPKERVKLYERLLEFYVPKLSKTQIEEKKTTTIDIVQWAEQSGQTIEDAEIEDNNNDDEDSANGSESAED